VATEVKDGIPWAIILEFAPEANEGRRAFAEEVEFVQKGIVNRNIRTPVVDDRVDLDAGKRFRQRSNCYRIQQRVAQPCRRKNKHTTGWPQRNWARVCRTSVCQGTEDPSVQTEVCPGGKAEFAAFFDGRHRPILKRQSPEVSRRKKSLFSRAFFVAAMGESG